MAHRIDREHFMRGYQDAASRPPLDAGQIVKITAALGGRRTEGQREAA
jgi:hypothetical protein